MPISLPDTTVISTFKATVSHFNKTVTSSGIMDLQIMDAKTGRVIMQEKIPAEYIWKSEWATFNGDERALSDEYVKLSQQKEQQPPSSQEHFRLFTTPMLDLIKEKLSAFYENY